MKQKNLLILLIISVTLIISLAVYIFYDINKSDKVNDSNSLNVSGIKNEEVKDTVINELQNSAVEGDYVEIGQDCIANPEVLKAKQGDKISFINTGKKGISLSFNSNNYTIPLNKTETVNLTVPDGLGLYGFRCDSNTTTDVMVIFIFTNN